MSYARRFRVLLPGIVAGSVLALTGCGQTAQHSASIHRLSSQSPTATATPNTSAPAATSAPANTTPPTATASPNPPGTAPSSAGAVIEVYGNCTTPSVRPTEIVLTCADNGVLFEHLRWASWNTTDATAIGTEVYNDCRPYCAAGHHHSIPDTHLTLTRPVTSAAGVKVWSMVRMNPEPPGFQTGPYHGGPFPLPTRPS